MELQNKELHLYKKIPKYTKKMITDISVDYQMFTVSHNKNIINSKVKVEHNKILDSIHIIF
jgi:hypothetical protein